MSQRVTGVLSTLVVDDEQLAREELTFLLKDFPEVEVLETATNGIEALKLINELEPDLVFLDVQLPGLDGLAVIRKLRERGGDLPHFVLTTAFDQYAVEAFRLEALDYVLKPIEKERLSESLARAKRTLDEKLQTEEELLEIQAPRSTVQRTKILVKTNNRNL